MGNVQNLFNYLDESGQPVGPLPLSELLRFAKAGVIPNDVQICEVGKDNWRTLSSEHEAQAERSSQLEHRAPEAATVSAERRQVGHPGGEADWSDAKKELKGAAREMAGFGKVVAKDLGQGLWGFVTGPVLLVVALIFGFKLLMWLMDTFWDFELL